MRLPLGPPLALLLYPIDLVISAWVSSYIRRHVLERNRTGPSSSLFAFRLGHLQCARCQSESRLTGHLISHPADRLWGHILWNTDSHEFTDLSVRPLCAQHLEIERADFSEIGAAEVSIELDRAERWPHAAIGSAKRLAQLVKLQSH